jgi:phosphate uptake regulator
VEFELVPIVAIFFTIGVPSLALAAHLVLRPMVRDIIGAIQAGKPGASSELEKRVARLEEAYSGLETQVTRLLETDDFRRQLESDRIER